ncbi:MAG: iron-sulfur cluster biosynthesis transcriptional regulator SufR [Cyanobacteria bacterium P01_E01_bin.45]
MAFNRHHPGHAKQAILQVLRKRKALSAQQLAEQMDISVQAVRRHLKDLEAEGAIARESVSNGMGRPQYLYDLTQVGLDRFPKHYDEFAVTFLNAMAERVGPEQMEEVLHEQWQQKASQYRDKIGEGPLRDRIASMAELRTQEGYMVDWYALDDSDTRHEGSGRSDSEQFVFSEYNCAISQVAESFPSVCGHELEMLQAVFPDSSVTRTHWMVGNEHQCGYLIAENIVA